MGLPRRGALVMLFGFGVGFAYWTLPRVVGVLGSIFDQLENLWTVEYFTRFVIRYLLLFGISFQFPVFLYGAAAAGAVTSDKLASGRRWAVLIIVVVGAVVSPTGDPLTLLLLATPLYVFYEATIWIIRWNPQEVRIDGFFESLPFEPDPFQVVAAEAVERGGRWW